MSLITILQTLLIGPLKLIFEIIFVVAERVIRSPGLAIVALSLVINVLMLPLHRRADAIQEESRDKEARLRDGVDHIKKTFGGDERMMILQTYYRQNDYRPTDVLNGSVSLLLEVPFFMAAYQFLSNLAMLNGESFGPIADMGAPDGMLVIGSIAINVLPILMTLINILSGAIYSKGFPMKTKIQMYGLALLFLVVLYDSPSGLVFYWTLNNLFSLVKNILTRVPWARKAGSIALFAAGAAAVVFGIFIYDPISLKRKLFVIAAGLLMMSPVVLLLLKGKIKLPKGKTQPAPNGKLFFLGSLFLTIQTGMLIPSAYIAESPLEYVDLRYFHDPILYIVMATLLAAGTFLIWMRVFYWLATPKAKVVFDKAVWILCGIFLVNYMFFGRDLGVVYSNLQFAHTMKFSSKEVMTNLVVMAAMIPIMLLLIRWQRPMVTVLLAGSIALGSMSVLNILSIRREVADTESLMAVVEEQTPEFPLSTEGKNVVVIMLDRALGQTVPYIFNEKPQLKEQFEGFTYYENTVSFGGYTVFASPSMLAGYEYTPVELNKKDDTLMIDKHNEALKVLPVLFTQNGYQATLLDPVYANYKVVPDLSVFDDYPEIDAYLTNGVYIDNSQRQAEIDANYRNFFCFSLMKSAPVSLQISLYSKGTYNRAPSPDDIYAGQVVQSNSSASGYQPKSMDEYAILDNMGTMTRITRETVNTYMFMDNTLTHEPMLLQTPEYVPAAVVDNTAYDAEHKDRFTVDGKTLTVKNTDQMRHYHVNMAALLKLGEWFDYLRENGVYDNTRIILVSDHGRDLGMRKDLLVDTGLGYSFDVSYFNPLLMVKDFDSHEFSVSSDFMTNADVPTLALEGLVEDPINPFTGNPIDSSAKYDHAQLITTSERFGTTAYLDRTTYLPSLWAAVTDDIWDAENWSFCEEETILKEHVLP